MSIGDEILYVSACKVDRHEAEGVPFVRTFKVAKLLGPAVVEARQALDCNRVD